MDQSNKVTTEQMLELAYTSLMDIADDAQLADDLTVIVGNPELAKHRIAFLTVIGASSAIDFTESIAAIRQHGIAELAYSKVNEELQILANICSDPHWLAQAVQANREFLADLFSDDELENTKPVMLSSPYVWSVMHDGIYSLPFAAPWEIPEGFNISPDGRECGLNLDQQQAKKINIDFPFGFALIVMRYVDGEIVRLLPINNRNGKFMARYRFDRVPQSVDCYPVSDSVPNIWKLITPEAIEIAREDSAVITERRLSEGIEAIAKRIQI